MENYKHKKENKLTSIPYLLCWCALIERIKQIFKGTISEHNDNLFQLTRTQ